MRIAYLSFESPEDGTGVGGKIAAQIDAWSLRGHQARALVLRPSTRRDNPSVQYVNSSKLGPPMLTAALGSRRLSLALQEFAPDLIYMRQMIWFPGLIRALDGQIVIDEVNSDIVAELDLANVAIKKWLFHSRRRDMESKLAGRVAVTRELASRYPAPGRITETISNGYDFDGVPPLVRREKGRPQLVLAASADVPWHGLDRLLVLAQGMPEADFHLVGPFAEHRESDNVHFHGVMNRTALFELYRKMHFGLGPLALERKSLNEASPLKVREYIAHGLPVLSSHLDTDLSGEPYYLQISGFDEDPGATVEKVRRFIATWRGREFPHADARAKLSVESKERQRLALFERVLAGG